MHLHVKRIKRLTSEGLWSLTGQVSIFIASLILVRVLTNYLDPSEYGQVALGLTAVGLVNQVIMGGITAGIGRYYSVATQRDDLAGYLSASKRLLFLGTVVILILSFFIIFLLHVIHYSYWIATALSLVLFSISNAYNGAYSTFQNASRNRIAAAVFGSLDIYLRIAIVFLVMLLMGYSYSSVLIGYCISSCSILGVQTFWFFSKYSYQLANVSSSFSWRSEILNYSYPFAIWGSFAWLQQRSARWSLELYESTDQVGLYSALFQITYLPVTVAASSLISFLYPIFFSMAGDASTSDQNSRVQVLASRVVLISLILTIIVVLLSYFFGDNIFNLFLNHKYQAAAKYTPLLVMAGCIFSIAQIYSTKILSLLRPQKILSASIISSIVGIVSSYVGVFYFSVLGACISMLIHAITYLFLVVRAAILLEEQASQ